MSRLDELIAELCPDGVEYKKLKEITSVLRGKRLTKSQLLSNGEYPVFHGGIDPLGFYSNYNRDADSVMIINVGASAGTVGYSGNRFWSSDGCFCIARTTALDNRFLYHFLKNNEDYLISHVRVAGIPTLDSRVLEQLYVPVPPLPVQQEIVHILDHFTELTAELQKQLDAELTARKKQYEYYRDSLLTRIEDSPKKKLGETCLMRSGKAIQATMLTSMPDDDHCFPCYGGNGIRGFIKDASHSGEYPIIGRQGALCGNVNYANGDFYATEHAIVVKSLGEYNQRFLYYLLISMNLNQYKSQGAQPGLAVSNIEKVVASVPPLKYQEMVVSILDRFDSLCNDLSSGLPAEIAARQKQYEYYRDKLLTFPEKG